MAGDERLADANATIPHSKDDFSTVQPDSMCLHEALPNRVQARRHITGFRECGELDQFSQRSLAARRKVLKLKAAWLTRCTC